MKRLLPAILVLLFSNAWAQKAVPELWGQRVHDDAHILKTETVDKLEKSLKAYEDSTSNQIAILIVPSLDGDVLEGYSLRIAEKWQLGKKGKDNGVLLLIAVDDHKMRIEVGQGLEGVLTDAQSNRIIRNEIAPAFRRNEYDAGVEAGINGIVKAIAGEYKADDVNTSSDLSLGEKFSYGLFIFGILGLFTLIALFTQGCMGWGLYAFLLPFYAVFPWIVIGVTGAKILFGIYFLATPIFKIFLARSKWGKEQLRKWKESAAKGGSGASSGWGG